MFKKIKEKWNKLDDRTKKALKVGAFATACVGSLYVGANITKKLTAYKEKHRFDAYPRMKILFGRDDDLKEYYIALTRYAKDNETKTIEVGGCLLGNLDETLQILQSWVDYINEIETKSK